MSIEVTGAFKMSMFTSFQHGLRGSLGLTVLLIMITGCGNSSSSGSGVVSGGSTGLEQTAEQEFPVIPVSNAFDDARLTEASGIQRSLLVDGIYYIHNDSDNEPVVYVSDSSGNVAGSITVSGAASIDWESIGGMLRDGVPSLLVADIGDNREDQNPELLLMEEPAIDELEPGFDIAVSPRIITMSYGDGLSYNAEALYVDGDNDTVVVLTKDGDAASSQSIWKGSLSSGLIDGSLVLQYGGDIGITSVGVSTAITGADINPAGREIAVLTYGSILGEGRIHLWTAREGEGTTDALTRPADETIDVPILDGNFQAEGISYSPDGNYLLVTAEVPGVARSVVTVVAR